MFFFEIPVDDVVLKFILVTRFIDNFPIVGSQYRDLVYFGNQKKKKRQSELIWSMWQVHS